MLCSNLFNEVKSALSGMVAGPTVWNSLPDELRDPACDVDSFKQFFKNNLVQLLLV